MGIRITDGWFIDSGAQFEAAPDIPSAENPFVRRYSPDGRKMRLTSAHGVEFYRLVRAGEPTPE